MSHSTYELKAELRERVGKGSSRELRRNGRIPAVIYGDKQEPLSISLPNKEVTLKYPGPKPTEKDVAMQEKERMLALRVPKCDIGTFSKEKGKCIKQ